MLMRIVLGTVLLASGALGARAQEAPPPPAAAPPPAASATAPAAPTQTTEVHGAPPDLAGRWLILFDLEEKAVKRTIPSFVEIRAQDGRPEILEHFVNLPPEMAAVLEKHNVERTRWDPTAADLTELADDWAELPKAERSVTQVTNDLWEPAAFSETEREDPDLQGAVWVMRQTLAFAPGGQRPASQINVFAGKAREGTAWRGGAVVAQVVAAPFPVPITLHGTFRMLRLEATPGRGFLARLLDAFRGCGR